MGAGRVRPPFRRVGWLGGPGGFGRLRLRPVVVHKEIDQRLFLKSLAHQHVTFAGFQRDVVYNKGRGVFLHRESQQNQEVLQLLADSLSCGFVGRLSLESDLDFLVYPDRGQNSPEPLSIRRLVMRPFSSIWKLS